MNNTAVQQNTQASSKSSALAQAIHTVKRYEVGFSRTPNIFNKDGSCSLFSGSGSANGSSYAKMCLEAWEVVCKAVNDGEISVGDLFATVGHPITDKRALQQLGLDAPAIEKISKDYQDARLAQLMQEHERLANMDYGRNNG